MAAEPLTASARNRLSLLASAVILLVAIAGPAARGATKPPAPRLPGVPRNVSLLFAVEFKQGTLTPDPAAGRLHYVLTLSGVRRMGTWFSDRPARDAGRVGVAHLFDSWSALGFAAIPPNAAVVLDSAPANRDAMAVELHLRSFDARTDEATFVVRTLGSLGDGLVKLNHRLGLRIAPRFTSGALFIDNGAYPGDCILGQPQLMDVGASIASSHTFNNLLPADGQVLQIQSNRELFAVYGTTFGGNGTTTFALPNMSAPSGTTWFICRQGTFPDPQAFTGCYAGQVNYLIPQEDMFVPMPIQGWLPADGETIPASQLPVYAQLYAPGQTNVTLPSMSAPPGLHAYVCVDNGEPAQIGEIGELQMFEGTPWFTQVWNSWLPANGAATPISTYDQLYGLSADQLPALSSGALSRSTASFTVPNIPAPVTGVSWWVATEGYWPESN